LVLVLVVVPEMTPGAGVGALGFIDKKFFGLLVLVVANLPSADS